MHKIRTSHLSYRGVLWLLTVASLSLSIICIFTELKVMLSLLFPMLLSNQLVGGGRHKIVETLFFFFVNVEFSLLLTGLSPLKSVVTANSVLQDVRLHQVNKQISVYIGVLPDVISAGTWLIVVDQY